MLCLPHLGVRASQTLASSAIRFASSIRAELTRPRMRSGISDCRSETVMTFHNVPANAKTTPIDQKTQNDEVRPLTSVARISTVIVVNNEGPWPTNLDTRSAVNDATTP